ncbi:unnamed protein product [Gordionus sp. m RMFG-2023]
MSIVIFNGGESSPHKPLIYPTFDFNFRIWPNGSNHLTGEGKKQMENLGRSFKDYYKYIDFPAEILEKVDQSEKLLTKYDREPIISNKVYKRDDEKHPKIKQSANINKVDDGRYHFRTIKIDNYVESAHHFAQGFFGNVSGLSYIERPLSPSFYLDSINHTYNESYNMISPVTVKADMDYLLSSGRACKKFNKYVYNALTQSPEAKFVNIYYKTLFEILGPKAGINNMDLLKLPLLLHSLLILNDTVSRYEQALENNSPMIDISLKGKLNLPQWINQTILKTLFRLHDQVWRPLLYGTKEQIKLGVGQLFNRIIFLIKEKLQKAFIDSNDAIHEKPEMFFFVVPDYTLYALRLALNANDMETRDHNESIDTYITRVMNVEKIDKINYGQALIIEFESVDHDKKDFLLKFYEKKSAHPKDLIKMYNAGECGKSCSLVQFYNQIKDILPKQIEKECRI